MLCEAFYLILGQLQKEIIFKNDIFPTLFLSPWLGIHNNRFHNRKDLEVPNTRFRKFMCSKHMSQVPKAEQIPLRRPWWKFDFSSNLWPLYYLILYSIMLIMVAICKGLILWWVLRNPWNPHYWTLLSLSLKHHSP